MYKCFNCKAVFECVESFYEEPNRVPSPFGSGYVDEGGGDWEGCPECQSSDYTEIEFDGCCPNCGKQIVEDKDWAWCDDFNVVCPYCKYKFGVSYGEITDYSEDN